MSGCMYHNFFAICLLGQALRTSDQGLLLLDQIPGYRRYMKSFSSSPVLTISVKSGERRKSDEKQQWQDPIGRLFLDYLMQFRGYCRCI